MNTFDENEITDGTRRKRNGIYFLPNAITLTALLAAFFSITQAMAGRYEHASVLIFVSMICDGLDGRIARLTNSQSSFGEQLDSIVDMVSFGVAPALVA